MMNKLLQGSKLFLKRNGSTILTVAGAVGVVATAVMAVKATPKAMTLLELAEEEKGEELTKTEIFKTAAPAYIPAAATGVSTIACIFGANVLNKRQQAALTSAYALLDSSYKEYKNKVKELHGEEADAEIKTEIAKDHYDEEKPDLKPSKDERLFFDFYSMRYFYSTLENVLRAEHVFNEQFMMNGSACLNELYDMWGLARIDSGYQLGWPAYSGNEECGYNKIEFVYDRFELDEDLEAICISMPIEPTEDYMW